MNLLSHTLPIVTQSMTFLGETNSQTIVNSRLGFIFPNGSIIHNDSGVYFQTSTPVPIRVPNSCDFATLKTRIHITLNLTYEVFLDEIHYRQPVKETCNYFLFQCMQLKNDDDVNTMLMCNDQFSCVGPIELLCTIGRTLDEILNLLECTMTHTHDALLYYNGRWNMPRQNNFLGYAFTGKNPKKFEILSGCTIDELKDLIKQVALKGIPPHEIHESQTLRQLFFRQRGRFEYSDKVTKYEIIELKTNDEVYNVLVQSNYWKKYEPIEILAVFTKHVMEMEDDMVATSLNNSMQGLFFCFSCNFYLIECKFHFPLF